MTEPIGRRGSERLHRSLLRLILLLVAGWMGGGAPTLGQAPSADAAAAPPTDSPSAAASPAAEPTSPPDSAPSPPSARLPIPGAEALAAADELVREVYAREIARADDSAKRKALAQLYYDEARETDDDPAGCYVLLREARELAKGVGDAKLAVAAVDETARRFEIDGQALQQETLRALADAARTPSAAREVAHVALDLMDAAADAERFSAAMDYARAAYAAAKKARDGALVNDTLDRGKAVQARQQEYEQIAAARATLAAQPDDPAANLAVGRYLCLAQGDWEHGLPLLVKGGESPYREPAEIDLGQPDLPDDQLALADRWWDLAEPAAESERAALRERAGFWYRQAQDRLTGLPKTKATRRLVELKGYSMSEAAATPATPAPPKEAESSAAAADGPAFPAGEWVDLMRWIDPSKDQQSPAWRNTGKALDVVPASGLTALKLPVHPLGDYAVRLQFTRVAGFGMIGVALPVGSRQCLLALNYNGQANGIDTVDGQRADQNSTTFAGALNNGRRYALEIQVKLVGNDAHITAELDGRALVSYRGPAASLSMHRQWTLPQREALGLYTQAAVQFEAIRFQSATGSAKYKR